jgi:AcrR family transcriptional regulator
MHTSIRQVRILDAATGIFSRHGFKKSSVEQIAAAAGVGKGTVYLRFQSKEDLFYQVLVREARTLAALTSKGIDPRDPADELLVTRTLALWEAIGEQRLLADLLLGRHEEVLPKWAEQLAELRTVLRHPLVEVLELGVRQGTVRRDVDRESLATILLDLRAASLIVLENTVRTVEEQERLGLTTLDVLMNGIRAHDPVP